MINKKGGKYTFSVEVVKLYCGLPPHHKIKNVIYDPMKEILHFIVDGDDLPVMAEGQEFPNILIGRQT